jgi:hypothetical protein
MSACPGLKSCFSFASGSMRLHLGSRSSSFGLYPASPKPMAIAAITAAATGGTTRAAKVEKT